jgi:hypothetical protein
MTVVITLRTRWPAIEARQTLAVSSAFPTAADALTALIPLPPGWTFQNHRPEFASYHAPDNSLINLHLIVAQEPRPRIFFLG